MLTISMLLRPTLAILFSLSLGLASYAVSADDINQDEVLELRRSGKIMPLQDILNTIAKRYPSLQVLEVELELERGRYLYEIDILTSEGVVRELEVDAQNGTIVDDELGD